MLNKKLLLNKLKAIQHTQKPKQFHTVTKLSKKLNVYFR